MIQQTVGPRYRVTADVELIDAGEDERRGGRTDDARRAADIQDALESDEVRAVLAIRGGAWLARILPRIDFDVLKARSTRVAVFGFSELTTLVNIVAAAENGIGIYDMGPAFLTYGLKRHAAMQETRQDDPSTVPATWMRDHLRPEFDAFVRDVVQMIEGKGSSRSITARGAPNMPALKRDDLPERFDATFVGGNLAVTSTLIGSRYADCIDPAFGGPPLPRRWLVLEDFNDKIERVDRFLAHLTLARFWDRCAGLLLGDFHKGYEDLTPAILELLPYHLQNSPAFPILLTKRVGHIWPMSPLPINVPTTITRNADGQYDITWPASTLQTV